MPSLPRKKCANFTSPSPGLKTVVCMQASAAACFIRMCCPGRLQGAGFLDDTSSRRLDTLCETEGLCRVFQCRAVCDQCLLASASSGLTRNSPSPDGSSIASSKKVSLRQCIGCVAFALVAEHSSSTFGWPFALLALRFASCAC